jgi:hypothetical protein
MTRCYSVSSCNCLLDIALIVVSRPHCTVLCKTDCDHRSPCSESMSVSKLFHYASCLIVRPSAPVVKLFRNDRLTPSVIFHKIHHSNPLSGVNDFIRRPFCSCVIYFSFHSPSGLWYSFCPCVKLPLLPSVLNLRAIPIFSVPINNLFVCRHPPRHNFRSSACLLLLRVLAPACCLIVRPVWSLL